MSDILDREDFVKLVWSKGGDKEDKLLTHDAALREELQLAIAHDRQPYPTAEAYAAVCAALLSHKKRIAELERGE